MLHLQLGPLLKASRATPLEVMSFPVVVPLIYTPFFHSIFIRCFPYHCLLVYEGNQRRRIETCHAWGNLEQGNIVHLEGVDGGRSPTRRH